MSDTSSRLLLIGDQRNERAELRHIFEDKYYILEAENLAQGTLLLKNHGSTVAAVIVDVPLKPKEMRQLAELCHPANARSIPLLCIITPTGTGSREETVFLLGADDVVLKPYTSLSIRRRVQVLVDLNLHQWDLQHLVEQQSATIRHNNQIMVDALSSVIEYRSGESGKHVLRIRHFTKVLLEEVARNHPEYELTPTSIDIIAGASALHDIGKISIPDTILNKPGKLTAEEIEVMKTHTTIGSELVSSLSDMGDREYLRYMYNIALYHHERYDGKGYPQGLKGEQIPICAQAVGLTDAFDALTTKRVYKDAYDYETATSMILNGECGVFAPHLLACFKRVQKQFVELAKRYADGHEPTNEDFRMPLPAPSADAVTPLQESRTKNQALLQILDATVIEMDMDARTYHVIYSPDADFSMFLKATPYDKLASQLMAENIHPDERSYVAGQYNEGVSRLFLRGANLHRFTCRMYSSLMGGYVPHEVTLQRVYQDEPQRRVMMVVFRKLQHDDETPRRPKEPATLTDNPAIRDLTGAVLCCKGDGLLTVVQGIASLEMLTGYRIEELWTQFHNSVMELIPPEDRRRIDDLDTDQLRSDKTELAFRLMRKDREPLWVLGKARPFINADGARYYYLTLSDVTSLKKESDRMERRLSHVQTIYERSGTITFEWSRATDRLICSDAWFRRFGYPVEERPFSQQMSHSHYIHPDDMEPLRQAFARLSQGSPIETFDMRVINSEGQYLWNRVRSVSLADDDGVVTSIVGVIYDIDRIKKDALAATQQAQQDELTALDNRNSTQEKIRDYLDHREANTCAALLMLDIDNFKTVNDTRGHFFGDAVLRQTAQILKSLFRVYDVVGRIGGDEFMVLIKDVPGRPLVEDKCQLVVDTLGEYLASLDTGMVVSTSVGCAIAPDHGFAFTDLYRCADEALYQAKKEGKNCFRIYDSHDKTNDFLETITHTIRIDCDTRPAITEDDVVRFVFRSLYDSLDIAATIREMLAFVGVYFNVSRVYIFENSDDNRYCSNTFEWCNAGITPEIDNLQNICYETDLPDWEHVYDEQGILYCSDISHLAHPTARALLEPQGIKSLLHCTIRDRGVFRGYIGFDECKENVLWTQHQVEQLKLLAGVLAVFVQKLRQQ